VTRLDLVVGPNGAGKSTFVRLVVAPERTGAVYVNADVIAAERWPEAQLEHAYEAAELARRTREQLIVFRRPFIAETVFSHPSKLDFMDAATAAGFYVALHVLMVPEDLAVARVARRHAQGGHDVPVDKIRGRYQRLWTTVVSGVPRSNVATFWDNSGRDGPLQVAHFIAGLPAGPSQWPTWAPAELTARWPR